MLALGGGLNIAILPALVSSLAFGRRTGCHTICWISPFMILGRKIAMAGGIPSLRLRTVPDSCISCHRCNASCPMSLDVESLVKQGEITDDNCILCGKCIDSCYRETIGFRWKPAAKLKKMEEIEKE